MTALILDVLRVAALGLAVMFLWDVWRLIRKAITAIDRDQDIMDAVETHEPEYMTFEEAEIVAVHVAGMSREDALVAFIDAYDKRYSNDHRAD
ncbi:MAG: hypothetical protein L0L76_10440 [Yaniella sp.]|uniref:hypothetical protein n=1 Tax=Yaniella sp. TaxID=2773929 RepID=UPI0026494254|nr:hypothetical protein [Yaniella sp.]MDN6759007.1 hypothetical protein [Yaniella sp.]